MTEEIIKTNDFLKWSSLYREREKICLLWESKLLLRYLD